MASLMLEFPDRLERARLRYDEARRASIYEAENIAKFLEARDELMAAQREVFYGKSGG